MKKYNSTTYTDEQIKYLIEEKRKGRTWESITKSYNNKYADDKTANSLRKTYSRYEDFDFSNDEFFDVYGT